MSLLTPPIEWPVYGRPSASCASADAIPIQVNGTYHIFHLTTPPHTIHHPPRLRSSWSRIQSRDLVHWTRDETPAIRPGNASSAPDANGAWTGCAIVDPDAKMHIFYTGYSLAEQGKQTILHTQADDLHGSSFGATEPIKIRHSNGSQAVFEDIDFRDAYVFFNELTSEWWMLVATRLATGPTWFRGCIALLTSTDLEEWTMQPGPLYSPGDMYCPECPELFRLPNGKWYLLYSRFAAPDAGTVYRVADSPLGPFRIPRDGSGGRIDGRRWYAAKSCPKHDDPAQRVSFGWIADKCDADGKWLWGGDLALPRVLSANGDGSLLTSVAQEPIDLFLETSKSLLPVGTHHDLSSIGSVATEFLPLGDSCDEDLVLEFSVGLCDASAYGLILNSDKDLRGYRVSFDSRNAGTCDMTLLCDQIPLDDFWADQYNLHLPRPVDGPELVRHKAINASSKVMVVLRDELLELFCNDRSMSFRLGPRPDPALRLGFFVRDGVVRFENVKLSGGGVFHRSST